VTILQAQIAALSKDAQLLQSPIFLGLDRNRLAKWDLRTEEGVVQWTAGKDFAQRTKFTCMATSGHGHVVIGSHDGQIRLYNANTLTQVSTGSAVYFNW
jgi:WD40 repeat protein